jgi:hypothetical protein
VDVDAELDRIDRRARRSVTALLDATDAIARDDLGHARTVLGRLIVDDRRAGATAVVEALAAASVLTLDRLGHAVAQRARTGAGRPDPLELVDRAAGYGVASRTAVLTAAWRLDAVRRGDHDRALLDLAESGVGGERAEELDLLAGAAALLAATTVDGEPTGAAPAVSGTSRTSGVPRS